MKTDEVDREVENVKAVGCQAGVSALATALQGR